MRSDSQQPARPASQRTVIGLRALVLTLLAVGTGWLGFTYPSAGAVITTTLTALLLLDKVVER